MIYPHLSTLVGTVGLDASLISISLWNSLIVSEIWSFLPGSSSIFTVIVFLAGLVIGSFNSSYVGRVIKAGDAKRANEFKELEREIPHEGFDNLTADQIIQNLTFEGENIETTPTRARLKDFVQSMYKSATGDTGEDNNIERKMKTLQENSRRLTIEDNSLLNIVTKVKSNKSFYEQRNSNLSYQFFEKFHRYLKDESDLEGEPVTDEELYGILNEIDTALENHRKMNERIGSITETLQEKGYEANSIPTDPDWEELHSELGSRDETELSRQIKKLVSILQLYERELSASRSSQSEQLEKIEILERIREHVDEEWLRDTVETDGEDVLVVAAREGTLGGRVISSLAKELLEERNTPDSTLLETLADQSTSQEDEIETSLADTLETLQEYETIQLQLEGVDHSELLDRIGLLEDDIESMSSEVRSRVIGEHAKQLSEEIERISETNRLDLYAISKQIEYLEWAVQNLDKSTDHGSVEDLIDEVDGKREKVEDMLKPGKFRVTAGHNITQEFVDLANEFRAEATKALDKGDGARARALLVSSHKLLDTVEHLYTNRNLREYLQLSKESNESEG